MGGMNSTPGSSNIMATGSTMFINDKGKTVTDTFHHFNGESVRSTETGQLPSTGGGFISQSFYTPWTGVVVVATVFIVISTLMYGMARQKLNRKKTQLNSVDEEEIISIPLYSINKSKPLHASGAKWSIDLDEVDLEA